MDALKHLDIKYDPHECGIKITMVTLVKRAVGPTRQMKAAERIIEQRGRKKKRMFNL